MDLRGYLDIEYALASRLSKSWRPVAYAAWKKAQDCIAKDDFAGAYEAAKDIDLTDVGLDNQEWIKYWLQQAVVFGAAIASAGLGVSAVGLGSHTDLLDHQTRVMCTSLEYNATLFLYQALVQSIAQQEAKAKKSDAAPPTPPATAQPTQPARFVRAFTSFRREGDAYLQMVSSLHTSRLAVWGFMAEADVYGISQYKLQAVLDGRTSRFCRFINGKVFPTEAGRNTILEILSAEDPNDVRTLQPWPRQTNAAMAAYQSMTIPQLIAARWHIPPFHPLCRTLPIKIDQKVTASKPVPVYTTPKQQPKAGDSPKKTVSTPATFAEAGITLTEKEAEHWNKSVGVSPTQALSMLSGKSPVQVLARKFLKGKLIQMLPSGDIKFAFKTSVGARGAVSLNQVYDPFTKVMYMNYQEFKAVTAGQGSEWVQRLYAQSALLSTGIGAEAMMVAAPTAVAIIAHANLGFLPASVSSWYDLKTGLLDELLPGGDLSAVAVSLSSAELKVVKDLLGSKDMQALWALCALPYKVGKKPLAEVLFKGVKIDMMLPFDSPGAVSKFWGALQ